MRSHLLVISLVLVVEAGLACGSSSDATDSADAGEAPKPSVPSDGLSPAADGPAGSGGNTSLPCEVQAVLENRCIACHDGAQQIALLSYANLTSPSKSDPSKSLAKVALERMTGVGAVMPPPPAEGPTTDEIAVFAEWITAGTPKNATSCTDAVPVPDAGANGSAGDAGPPTTVCTSGKTWKDGTDGSGLMQPGVACNACHQKMGGPNLAFAGTVYPTLHEPDLCNGKAPPPTLEVVVTDSANRQVTMTTNQAGNFYARQPGRFKAPFTVVVNDTTNKKSRAMVGKVTSGDCNSCHTVNGTNSAPGRVMAP